MIAFQVSDMTCSRCAGAAKNALEDRQFVVANGEGGPKTVVLDVPTAYGREVHDMDRLDGSASR